MKRTPFLLMLLFCAVLGQLRAQPGYLGRLNMVRYDMFAMPSLYRSDGSLAMNHSHELGWERVVSRRTVFGTSLGLLPLFSRYDQLPYPPNTEGVVTRQSMGLGVHVKLYPFLRKGWLAPLGPYMRLSFQFNRFGSKFHNPVTGAVSPWSSHFYAAYGLEMGYSEVLFGRMVLDMGFRFCIADFLHGAANGLPNDSYSVYRDAYDLLETELFKLHLGIGLLL